MTFSLLDGSLLRAVNMDSQQANSERQSRCDNCSDGVWRVTRTRIVCVNGQREWMGALREYVHHRLTLVPPPWAHARLGATTLSSATRQDDS